MSQSRRFSKGAARRTRIERVKSTRLELLLAAEKLFAIHGMRGISLRQIVAATRQRNLSTVHYHFGSRDALVYAICDYRMPPIELDRARRIARFAQAPPSRNRRVIELLRILIEPSAQPIFASRGHSYFRRLLLHCFVSEADDIRGFISDRYDMGIRETAGLLRQALPQLSKAAFDIRWSLLIRSLTYLLASMEMRAEQLPWRKAEVSLRREISELAAAFSGFLGVPDRGGAADIRKGSSIRSKRRSE